MAADYSSCIGRNDGKLKFAVQISPVSPVSRRKRAVPFRVLRGGSWNNNANKTRSANRNNNNGFRVVAVVRTQ